jgi:phosphomannomutase / phosphoglucomutase
VPSYNIVKNINSSIFRAYDIRGVVTADGLSCDVIYTIGLAIGSQIIESGDTKVVIGRDGRLSSPALHDALQTGLHDSGCDITDIGLVPSPVVYYAAITLKIDAAVMLTGSHNPKDYNGLKIILGKKTLTAQKITMLYDRIIKGDLKYGSGSIKNIDLANKYLADIVARIKLAKPLKVVIDCGNGAAGEIAPRLFKALGCDVVALWCEIDGNFPNHHPNPSESKNMQDLIAAVKSHKADIGLAFDGDADRIGVVSNTGEIIWPDRQMMLFAVDVLSRNPGGKIVFDVKSTNHLAAVIKENGGVPILWKTGHSVLKAKMIAEKAVLAGEMSGHIFFQDNWYGFDDGLYVGSRMLQLLAASDNSLSDIFASFPLGINTPELHVEMADNIKFAYIEKLKQLVDIPGAKINYIDGLRIEYPFGWALIRASNTTPCLTLRFEADSEALLADIQHAVKELMLSAEPSLDLAALA